MVVHLWLVENGRLWLQKRAPDRPLYPGRYDLAATGHIDPRETPEEAVCREAREEAGLRLTPDQLTGAGCVAQRYPRPDGFDDEIVHVFVYQPREAPEFHAGEEVARMAALPLTEFARTVEACAAQMDTAVQIEGESVTTEGFCCLHPVEWALVRGLFGM